MHLKLSQALRGVLLFLVAAVSIAEASVGADTSSVRKEFRVFSRVGFYEPEIYARTGKKQKVDLAVFGFPRIPLVFASALWPSGDISRSYDEAGFRDFLINKHGSEPIVCLDIEAFPIKGKDESSIRNLEILRQILRDARRALPNAQLGFYSIVPDSGIYWSLAKDKPEGIARWKEINRLTLQLAQEVDIVYPSLYTYSDNREEWLRAARYKLTQARTYGKPVYAFLMPQYHQAAHGQEDFDFIDSGFWRLQLETVHKYADGVIIFGLGKPWDPTASWWLETLRFLEANDLPQT